MPLAAAGTRWRRPRSTTSPLRRLAARGCTGFDAHLDMVRSDPMRTPAHPRPPSSFRVRHALAEALALDPACAQTFADTSLETVDVAGAASLLHTTPRAIYVRYSR